MNLFVAALVGGIFGGIVMDLWHAARKKRFMGNAMRAFFCAETDHRPHDFEFMVCQRCGVHFDAMLSGLNY